MFGYIKKDIYELKYKDIILYKNLYCSLCNGLKNNFGTISRLFTSYDATFFLAVFDGLDNNKKEMKIKCPLNPFLKKIKFSVSETALNYVSLISVYYVITKMEDNWIDEKKSRYKFMKNHILKNRKVQCTLSKNQNLINKLKKILEEYYVMENNPQNQTFDKFSNKMGELFGTVFSEFVSVSNGEYSKDVLYSLGFSIGKWIYIIDAFDDLKDDKKKNNFNPIFYMQDYDDDMCDDFICDKILFINNVLCDKMLDDLSELTIERNLMVIHNIIKFGMKNSILEIIKNKYN
ncbi:MAG: DUF5685 family protein [Acutalibacteraceae bacterium]